MGFLATHAKTGPAAVFADGDRRADDLDLLHNARGKVEQPGAAAAVGTDGERVIDPLVDFFGVNGGRSCRGWPGCPPRFRLRPPTPPGRGGLMMSLDGGLEELAEFFFDAASCTCRAASRSSRTAMRCSSDTQFGQR
jgi:hypothetical protein